MKKYFEVNGVELIAFNDILKEWMKDPEFRKESEKPNYYADFVSAFIDERARGVSSAEIAERAGVSLAEMQEFEENETSSFEFIKEVSETLGKKLEVRFM